MDVMKEIAKDVASTYEYKVGYTQGKEETITEILTLMHSLYISDEYCENGMDRIDCYEHECNGCFYIKLRMKLLQMRGGEYEKS